MVEEERRGEERRVAPSVSARIECVRKKAGSRSEKAMLIGRIFCSGRGRNPEGKRICCELFENKEDGNMNMQKIL